VVRRLMLVGTGPRGGEPPTDPNYRPYATSTDPATGEGMLEAFLYLFFSPSPRGQAAGRAFWERRHRRETISTVRVLHRRCPHSQRPSPDWRQVRGRTVRRARSITRPTLVVNGRRT
jgi:pimeloyl-ACP methyl ester carboxylesterase